MIKREKLYLIASNVDDSIKAQTVSYDVTLFGSYLDFEKLANEKPTRISTLIISSEELSFNSANMKRVLNVLNSPFVNVNSIIYLIDRTYDLNIVNSFLLEENLTNWSVYQNDVVDFKFISDIVSGEARSSDESQSYIVTYRVRAKDYIAQQNALKYEEDNHYMTDEDLLNNIPDEEEPEDTRPTIETVAAIKNIAGFPSIERTLFSYLMAQYYSLSGKTLIVEKDIEFHTLSELVTKSGAQCEFIEIDDLYKDINSVVNRIIKSSSRLIVIGAVNRIKYSYDFIFDVIFSNVKNHINFAIRECNLNEVPHGIPYTVVTPNDVPSILRTCSEIQTKIDAKRISFVGIYLRDIYPAIVVSSEMKNIVETVLGVDDLQTQVFRASSLILGGGATYDIRSIIK